MGRNGVGKTTLLRCIMGLAPDATRAGSVRRHDLTAARPEARAPLGIGYVPQGREIFPRLTVEENLRVGLPSAGRPAASAAAARDGAHGHPELVYELFPVLEVRCCAAAAATCPAASSSSSRSAARSSSSRRC